MNSGERDWQALLDLAIEGNADAFGILWQQYLRPQKLLPQAMHLLDKNLDDAEDMVQSVFEHLFAQARYRHITRRDLAGFTSYVQTMLHHRHIDYLREQKPTKFLITRAVINHLKFENVPDAIVQRLESIHQLEPLGKQGFLNFLRTIFGEELSESFQTLMLRYSRQESSRWRSLSQANRASAAKEPTMYHDLEQTEITRIFYDEIRPILTDAEWAVLSHKHADEDFSYRKFSAITGIPLSTLNNQYQSARAKILRHPKLRAYWKPVGVNDRDREDLEYARQLRYRLGHPQQAKAILTALLRKFRGDTASTDVMQMKAHILELLGGIAVLQNHVDQGLIYYDRARHLWKMLHDDEKQAATLLDLAVNHANFQFAGNPNPHRQCAWRHFQAAQALLHPAMRDFHLLQGKYSRRVGYFHANFQEYECAEQAIRNGMNSFEHAGNAVEFEVTRREFGVVLLRQRQYETAYQILEAIAAAPTLQSPIDQAKIFGLLSDLFFATRQPDYGRRALWHAAELCDQFDLAIQRRVLHAMLFRHRLPVEMLTGRG